VSDDPTISQLAMNSPTAKTQVETTTGQRQGDTENPVTKGESTSILFD